MNPKQILFTGFSLFFVYPSFLFMAVGYSSVVQARNPDLPESGAFEWDGYNLLFYGIIDAPQGVPFSPIPDSSSLSNGLPSAYYRSGGGNACGARGIIVLSSPTSGKYWEISGVNNKEQGAKSNFPDELNQYKKRLDLEENDCYVEFTQGVSGIAGTPGTPASGAGVGATPRGDVTILKGFSLQNPLKCGTIHCLLNAIAGFLYALALAVVTIMVLWGGFQILTAAGNPEGIDKGKRTLLWAVIGTVVILIAGGIADLTANIIGG